MTGFTNLAMLTATTLLLSNIVLSATAQESPEPQTSMTLKLDPPWQQAPVNGSQNVTVQFSGSVKCSPLCICGAKVWLNSSVDTGWSSAVSPDWLYFLDPYEHDFTVTVVVPAAAPHNITGKLVVRCHAEGDGWNLTDEASANITPAVYYKVGLETDKPRVDIKRGEPAFFSLRVRNNGNANDTFEMGFVNLKDLVNEKWTITYGGGQVPRIAPGDYRVTKVTAQCSGDGLFKGDRDFPIIVQSKSVNARDAGYNVSETLVFTVHVKDDSLAIISPYLLIMTWSALLAFMVWLLKRRPRGKR